MLLNPVSFVALVISLPVTFSQLVVNVKNKGGDVIREVISGNTTSDVVELQFQNTDGTLINQFIDFKSEVQIFRAFVLREEELGFSRNKPITLCFVSRFNKNEFISSDAMSKLRQKNPSTIRSPEEEKVPEMHIMDLRMDLRKTNVLSPYIHKVCQDANLTTYTKESDIRMWSQALGQDFDLLMSTSKQTHPGKFANCKDMANLTLPCLCHYHICVGWYPCGLKYCRGKDSTGRYVSYRCGIKTCRRFISYDFVAEKKYNCLWDDV
ncbi:out at first protein-like [Saccostrea cucullata]|uniref:out at first protein-like n=1 Tax=Saccostrea cuccullata TaxID=36930 RepID=UPI002ED077AE